MSRRHLSPAAAAEMLALLDHAREVEPNAPLPYLRGFLVARSGESSRVQREDANDPDWHPSVGRGQKVLLGEHADPFSRERLGEKPIGRVTPRRRDET